MSTVKDNIHNSKARTYAINCYPNIVTEMEKETHWVGPIDVEQADFSRS